MNHYYEEQIEILHTKLANVYRIQPDRKDIIDGLWARIERLDATRVRIAAKEDSFGEPRG